jgi:hypothetical protein
MSNRENFRSAWLLSLAGAFAITALSLESSAQDGPPPPVPADAAATARNLTGTVQAWNLSPRGTYEGLILKSGDKVVQINFPPDLGGYVAQLATTGDSIKVTAYARESAGDHDVFALATITGAKGSVLTVSRPEDARALHVEGKIASLNYGARGEVNGFLLDTGDFVHTGPETAGLSLAVGQSVTADGRGESMILGHNALDAETVNGVSLPRAPLPPHGHPPRPGDEPPPPR